MSELIKQQVSVLLGTVPLFAVNRISLSERYELPPVGDKGASQSSSKITREVQIDALLIGDERQATGLLWKRWLTCPRRFRSPPRSSQASRWLLG